jgi:hypothetical protein
MNHEWAGVIDVIHEHEILAFCGLVAHLQVVIALRVISP